MKPFFAVDRTEDDNNKNPNCEKFNILSICEETYKEYMERRAEDTQLQKKLYTSKTKQYIIVGFYIFILLIMFFISDLLTLHFDLSLSDPGYYVIFALPLIVAYFLPSLYKRYYTAKTKKFFESEELHRFKQKNIEWEKKMREELNIPISYNKIDIIWFHYKVIDGIITPIPQAKGISLYSNLIYWFHVKENNLYIADGLNSFAIELNSLKKIKKINKDLTLPRWKKDTHFTDPVYQECHIIQKGSGFNIESYYALEIEDKDETWELFFPNYELPAFERLTGLKAETN